MLVESVWIGFGSNLGNSVEFCRSAFKCLDSRPDCLIRRISPLYKTEPLGDVDQPWFINGVLEIKTSLYPFDLLDVCMDIESKLGRTRLVRWSPRTMDLDILIWENRIINSHELKIPHPQFHLRRFVLTPFHDLCADLNHPLIGLSISQLLHGLKDNLKVFPIHVPKGI
jgi:2-amino-4-hydroxy-6-hydroxymethyldihydropteridine diphosphokinase